MANVPPTGEDDDLMRRATEVAIRLFVIAGLVLGCYLLFQPFLELVVWSMILAVALYPVFTRLTAAMGGRVNAAGGIFIAAGIAIIVVPAWLLSESFYEGVQWLKAQQEAGGLQLPPPPASVTDWPLIGPQLFEKWSGASRDLQAIVEQVGPQLGHAAAWLVSTISGIGIGLLVTIASIVVAGLMLMHAEGGAREARAIAGRLGGEQGEAIVGLAVESIRSVAMGVFGVALVQSVLAGIGLFLADIPLAGLWVAVILVLAVAQLPPLIVLGPVIAYVFATSDSVVTQALFTIWSLLVSVSDSFLKPMMLGRGVDVPMIVILLGAIGGMIAWGVIGLFVGAVMLALGYKLFYIWLDETQEVAEEAS
jgi:predicted PurR-regulated permease PerM